MRGELRRRAETKKYWRSIMVPVTVCVFLIFLVVALYQLGAPAPDTDDRLCPTSTGPVGATVLLLDTSDPLTPKHKAELKRLAGQVRTDMDPGELLVAYELTQDPGAPQKLIEVCRPFKNPKDRTWRDDIHQGRRFAVRDWKHFEDELANGFPERESEPQTTSPLLETISVLAARHIPGKRGNEEFKVHLIVFSDLLQNTERLSHFRAYPDAKDMRRNARALLTDLTGTRVSLFRLERQEYAHLQTAHHYYWWTEIVQEQGGEIEWQDSM